ncbi:MAG: hypothetical protein KatS3mg129_1488 [Leptospiraceae bacterium]|nr:MAG: hypothetical protein KatS3mg129_1488 [Leptospiraceae bacterium]
MEMTELEKNWLHLEEDIFHHYMWDYISNKGTWQEIFVIFVQYNTSYYVLKALNKIGLLNHFYKENKRIALCVSEDNWKGKIENIQSTIKREKEYYIANLTKSYVFKAGLYIVISKIEDNNDIAILLLNDNPDIHLINRQENYSKFYDPDGRLLMDHFKLSFSGRISYDEVLCLSKNDYKKIFYIIPLREITTLSLVLLGLFYYENKNTISAKEKKEIEDLKNYIIKTRKYSLTYKTTKEIIHKTMPYISLIKRKEPQLEAIRKFFNIASI